MDPTHEFIRPTGSVRVRRGTVSRPAFNTISEGTSPVNTSAADASGFTPSGGTGGGGGSRGRRRAQTLTQRLFADNPYQPITDETPTGRARSPSNASLGSGAAHAVAPISVSIPIRASQEELRSAAASPTVVSGRRRGSSISHDEAHHGQDEVDLVRYGLLLSCAKFFTLTLWSIVARSSRPECIHHCNSNQHPICIYSQHFHSPAYRRTGACHTCRRGVGQAAE